MTQINIGTDCSVELERLIETKALLSASSGGGKSHLTRRFLEKSHGKVQQIIIDLEGEFYTLREKFDDYLLLGKTDGDLPLSIRTAELLAKTLLEQGVNAILDLSELQKHERITFVKRFLDSLIDAPKDLWHPCLIVLDEAHFFAPESGKCESANSVIELASRGRKRGFCLVAATQRISKLHKDVVAECQNRFIGLAVVDIDRKRASEECGFTSKEQNLSLRDLEPGEFYAFGPAMSREVKKIKVGDVITTHPKAGLRGLAKVPPATDKIKKMLERITNLPKEAEKELKTVQDLQSELRSLRGQLSQAQRNVPKFDPERDKKIQQAGYDAGVKESLESFRRVQRQNKEMFDDWNRTLETCRLALKDIEAKANRAVNIKLPEFKPIDNPKLVTVGANPTSGLPVPRKQELASTPFMRDVKDAVTLLDSGDIKITGGAKRMLIATAMCNPKPISKARMGMLSGMSPTSGSFSNYLSNLRIRGLIAENGSGFSITQLGLDNVGHYETLPTDPATLVNFWANKIGGGAGRMLKALFNAYPQALTKPELGEQSEMVHSSGSFSNYLSTLRTNALIEESNGTIKIAEEIMEG